ncbi:bifunctional glutamate N-acetyltransferase/amino-acid acetyltransferase ArgJ, partial [bacterium]|nr:bifunctional glutamate N-acetyltransferase/amino-acid acetyltransferase ArgJ [bacterium]
MNQGEMGGGALFVPGFRLGAVSAGLKKGSQLDMCVITSDEPCAAAGVFTRNRVVGEPVRLDRRHLRNPEHRAIVVNARISNVCTGPEGLRDAREMASRVAGHLGCKTREVFVASTGTIGPRLPMDKIRNGIDAAVSCLSEQGWEQGARAIMTTDTQPKMARQDLVVADRPVTIGGIAKGSGMIQPNLATMLCFITTDLSIEKTYLQRILSRVAHRSFNCVTVDGDTSTSDTVLVLANGRACNPTITGDGALARVFEEGLLDLCVDLARKIARDGEGARHLVTVNVRGARSEAAARRVAESVANSPLVKTAIYGRDANVGRLAMAAGKAGVPFNQSSLDLALNGTAIMGGGYFMAYDEKALTETLDWDEIVIDVGIGKGFGRATMWTCDLTEEYIHINADYRT